MKTILIAAGCLVVGLALGVLYGEATYRHLRKQVRELKAGTTPRNILRSVTRFLFVTTQVFALAWVSWSYGIATYSTVVLGQPFPVEELSRQAIITLLGMSGLKVVENIFEHNEGPVFGKSPGAGEPSQEEPPAEEDNGEGKG